ncbi:Stabilizer of axonemal microtubules 2 [Manis javanica]|nr:Stabilizer of axonemal microtubules 2 [Manis javanica]
MLREPRLTTSRAFQNACAVPHSLGSSPRGKVSCDIIVHMEPQGFTKLLVCLAPQLNIWKNIPPYSLLAGFGESKEQLRCLEKQRSDCCPYEIVKQPHHVPEEYKPKQGEIDLGTTYKRDFNSYKVQPVAIVRPLERQPVKKGKLDTVPTYKDDYRAWDIQKSELCKPEQSYHPRTVKFGNSTTFQDDYVPQEIKPRQSFKPSSNVKSSSAPFHGDTSHRLDYIPHQLEVKFARPKEVYKPTSQPFERSHNSSSISNRQENRQSCLEEFLSGKKREEMKWTLATPRPMADERTSRFQPHAQVSEDPVLILKHATNDCGVKGFSPTAATSHLEQMPHISRKLLTMAPDDRHWHHLLSDYHHFYPCSRLSHQTPFHPFCP